MKQFGVRIVEGNLSVIWGQLTRQSIRFHVLGPGTEGNGEVEAGEEQGPMGMARIEAFSG